MNEELLRLIAEDDCDLIAYDGELYLTRAGEQRLRNQQDEENEEDTNVSPD